MSQGILELPDDLATLISDLLVTTDLDAEPSDYTEVDAAMEAQGGNDDLEGLGGILPGVRSPAEAILFGRKMVKDQTYVGVGYCLKTVRTMLGVGALYPDATTAWEEAVRKVRGPIDDARWGAPIFWTNKGFGHVALDLRIGGLCLTTDYHRAGYVGIARTANLAAWCGGTYRGYTNDLNGVRIWEKPEPPFGLNDMIDIVDRALNKARQAEDRNEKRIEGLRKWKQRLVERRNA